MTGEKIKILHVIGALEVGGAETMLAKLVSRLDPARFENAVVSLSDEGPIGARIASSGIPVAALGARRGWIPPAAFGRFVGLARDFRPDVLQAWMYHAGLFAWAAKLRGVPGKLAWNLRCSDMDDSKYSRLSAFVRRACAWASPRPEVVLVNSRAGIAYHEASGFAPRRWEYVPNGFDTAEFKPDPSARAELRREWGVAEGDPVIGMAARFDPMKDHATFVAAAEIFLRSFPRVRFVLCGKGTGPAEEGIAELVHASPAAPSFLLLGRRDDVPGILAALDVFTLTSSFGEGFPNVLGEAMACGVPCVATDVGDAREIVGETGFVVKPRDPEALAAAWERPVSDAALRERLGRAARERVERVFGIGAIAGTYARIYTAMVEPVSSID